MKKFLNGEYVELTQEEIEELNTATNDEIIVEAPTVEERIASLESAMGDLAMLFIGGGLI